MHILGWLRMCVCVCAQCSACVSVPQPNVLSLIKTAINFVVEIEY